MSKKLDGLGIKLLCLLARKSESTKTWRLSVLWSAHEAKNKVKDFDLDTNMKMANNKILILISQQDNTTDLEVHETPKISWKWTKLT